MVDMFTYVLIEHNLLLKKVTNALTKYTVPRRTKMSRYNDPSLGYLQKKLQPERLKLYIAAGNIELSK